MDNLQVGLPVTLELDGEPHPIACVVTALTGETATLVRTDQVKDELNSRLKAGSAGFLVFGGSSTVLGLRGAAIMTPESVPLIDFVVTDGFPG
jgi:hypothetical protein